LEKTAVIFGWRGEFILRGALAPLGGPLAEINGAFKRGETPLYYSPSPNKNKNGDN
jgi:hypothetical protein